MVNYNGNFYSHKSLELYNTCCLETGNLKETSFCSLESKIFLQSLFHLFQQMLHFEMKLFADLFLLEILVGLKCPKVHLVLLMTDNDG